MAREPHTALDGRPGSLPVIHTSTKDVTFVMAPLGAPNGDQLVIRCDANGEVWISIRRAPEAPAE